MLQLTTLGHIGMQIFIFVVLSVIIPPHNVLTAHISKAHLPIVSLNVHELELMPKRKKERKRKPNSPRRTLRFIRQSSLFS